MSGPSEEEYRATLDFLREFRAIPAADRVTTCKALIDARIDTFLEEWPDTEFGPAHIVLSDGNIEDHHLDWCIGLLEAILGETTPSDEDRRFLDSMNWYRGGMR